MNRRRGAKIISGLLLAILFAGVHPAYGQPAIATFTGKIQEIGKATALGLGKHENVYVIKLDNHPNAEFRISPDEAVRSGLVDTASPSQIVTPRHSKGLGWEVRLTCDGNYQGLRNAPIYQVKFVERIGN